MLSAQGLPSLLLKELLPSDALIVETADLHASGGKNRMLVLWMRGPKKEVRAPGPGFCGDFVYGDSWVGPTKLSLIDTASRKVLNTISVMGPAYDRDPADSFRIPFWVGNQYYHVPAVNSKKEGKPKILHLQDLTGDGIASEFVLFMHSACGIVETSVLGYQTLSDRVLQYPVEGSEGKEKPQITMWVSQVFGMRPTSPGHWDFTWGPGHGTDVKIHEQVSFDKVRQRFVARHTTTPIQIKWKWARQPQAHFQPINQS